MDISRPDAYTVNQRPLDKETPRHLCYRYNMPSSQAKKDSENPRILMITLVSFPYSSPIHTTRLAPTSSPFPVGSEGDEPAADVQEIRKPAVRSTEVRAGNHNRDSRVPEASAVSSCNPRAAAAVRMVRHILQVTVHGVQGLVLGSVVTL